MRKQLTLGKDNREKKLRLNTETVRQLGSNELERVGGGWPPSYWVICPSKVSCQCTGHLAC